MAVACTYCATTRKFAQSCVTEVHLVSNAMVSIKHTLWVLGLPTLGAAAAVVTTYVTIGCGNSTSAPTFSQAPIPSSRIIFTNRSSAARSYSDLPVTVGLAKAYSVIQEEVAAAVGPCLSSCSEHGGDQSIRLSGSGSISSTIDEIENGLGSQDESLSNLVVNPGGLNEDLSNDQTNHNSQNVANDIYVVEASGNPMIGVLSGVSSVSYKGNTMSRSESFVLSSTIPSASNSQSPKPSSIQSTADNSFTSTSTRSHTPSPTPDKPWNHTVTAYFGSGETGIFPASRIPWDSITHLCYSFAKTQNASANWSVSVNESLLGTLSEGAQEHGVDLLLSIGGYGEGGKYFSDLAHTNASINAFVASFKTMVQKYKLAGIDIGAISAAF